MPLDPREALLKRLVIDEGLTLREAGLRLTPPISRERVRQLLKANGLRAPLPTSERMRLKCLQARADLAPRVLALAAKGLTTTAAAKELSISSRTIYLIIKEHGIVFKPQHQLHNGESLRMMSARLGGTSNGNSAVAQRVRVLGWSLARASTTPIKPRRMDLTVDGVTQTAEAWSLALGSNRHLVTQRLCNGWSVREACLTPVKQRRGSHVEASNPDSDTSNPGAAGADAASSCERRGVGPDPDPGGSVLPGGALVDDHQPSAAAGGGRSKG